MLPSGTRTRGLNVSSYNYLGFAQTRGGCADAVEACINRYGVSACGTRLEGGSLDLHTQAEALVARFVGQEDAMLCSMGFATNSTVIPALVGKGSLVISDEFNHASIRFGVRLSGANVRTYKHNNMKTLENLLREVISQGQPKTHRPWKKILLIVEGLFSMEGTLANLPVIMELKKKYKVRGVRYSCIAGKLTHVRSFISLLMKRTPSVRSGHTVVAWQTTLASTRTASTSSWARSQSLSVRREATSRDRRHSSTSCVCVRTPARTRNRCHRRWLCRSSRQWLASWVSR